MNYLADTADLSALTNLYDFFPLEGVTTNPTIIKQSGLRLSVAVDRILKITGHGMIHIQVMSELAEDMVREARAYKN